MKNIAIFNGFHFHYEMFGYIIHFCYINNFNLIVYTNFSENNGWLNFYKVVFNKKNYDFIYKNIDCFESEKNTYDLIVLPTDDDSSFNDNNAIINNKTIRIDHHYTIRRPNINKFIATRPFLQNFRKWSLPCFPLIPVEEKNKLLNNNIINIGIVGQSLHNYKVNIINRIKTIDNRPITINVIARDVNKNQFTNLKNEFKLNIFKKINTFTMMNILSNCHYILTDVSINKDYITENMSGAIPLAFSLLTPLIINKNTNLHYKFENIIEFDENANNDILLTKIDIEKLVKERQKYVDTFSIYLFEYMNEIR
jgi:hypothetical protein